MVVSSQLKTTFVQSSAAQPGSGWEKAPCEEQHHGTAAALRRQQHFNQQQRRPNSFRGQRLTFLLCFIGASTSQQNLLRLHHKTMLSLMGAFLNQ